MQIKNRTSLLPNESHLESAPAANDTHPGAQDLRKLADEIVRSAGANQLAVDILANLAAYPGAEGHEAQQALRKLYDNPGTGQARVDEQVRDSLVSAAHSICELALLSAPEISGGALELPLSITVAALACRYPTPEGGRDIAPLARAHIEKQLNGSALCPLIKRIMDDSERGAS